LFKQLGQLLNLFLAVEEARFFALALSTIGLVWFVKFSILRLAVRTRNIHQTHWLAFDDLDGIRVLEGILGDVAPTLLPHE